MAVDPQVTRLLELRQDQLAARLKAGSITQAEHDKQRAKLWKWHDRERMRAARWTSEPAAALDALPDAVAAAILSDYEREG